MRKAVIGDTTSLVEQLRFHKLLRWRRPVIVTLTVVFICTGLFAISLLDPASSALAARRLLIPWSSEAWPKRNDLQFVEPPMQLALGHDFEPIVIDGNQDLPDEVTLEVRVDSTTPPTQKQMKFNGGKMTCVIANVTQSFEYRAVGGDDVTPWQTLVVIEPPRITSSQLKLRPPAYTKRPSHTTSGPFQTIVGTSITLQGEADRPLSTISLVVSAGEELSRTELDLDESGTRFSSPTDGKWLVTNSGSYWFDVVSRGEATESPTEKWEFVAVDDMPPEVTIETPLTFSYLTTQAQLPLRVTAQDDLGIEQIELRYIHSSGSSPDDLNSDPSSRDPLQTVSLFEAGENESLPDQHATPQRDRRSLEHILTLASVEGLKVGDRLELSARASDFKPQWSQSTPIPLSIISQRDLLDRAGQKQVHVLGQINEALQVQRDAHREVQELTIQIEETDRLEQTDLDQLQSAELIQRRVHRLLMDDKEGVAAQLSGQLLILRVNQLQDVPLHSQIEALLRELERIDREIMIRAQRSLLDAIKSTRNIEDPSIAADTLQAPLHKTRVAQEEAVSALEHLVGELSEWDSYRRFARDIRQLQRTQTVVSDRTRELQAETLGRSASSLNSKQRASLMQASQAQRSLSRELDKLQENMQRTANRHQESQPSIADTLTDAADAVARQGTSAQMRQAATDIESNRIAFATQSQQAIDHQLQNLLDILANRGQKAPEQRATELRRIASELLQLKERLEQVQKDLKQATSETSDASDRNRVQELQQSKKGISDQLRRHARSLRRLQARQPATTLDKASQRVSQSAQSADDQNTERTQSQLDHARDLVDQAQRELRDAINDAEQEAAQQRLSQLDRQITALLSRQTAVVEATRELHDEMQRAGQLSRSSRVTALELSREEKSLATDATALATTVGKSEAVRFVLQSAARELIRAGARLGRSDVDDATLAAAKSALSRFQQLAKALQSETSEDSNSSESPSGAPPQEIPPEEAVRILAELRLLRSMQEVIHQRTAHLESLRGSGGGRLSPEQLQELADLSKEQTQLADLIGQLSSQSKPKTEQQNEVQRNTASGNQAGEDLP